MDSSALNTEWDETKPVTDHPVYRAIKEKLEELRDLEGSGVKIGFVDNRAVGSDGLYSIWTNITLEGDDNPWTHFWFSKQGIILSCTPGLIQPYDRFNLEGMLFELDHAAVRRGLISTYEDMPENEGASASQHWLERQPGKALGWLLTLGLLAGGAVTVVRANGKMDQGRAKQDQAAADQFTPGRQPQHPREEDAILYADGKNLVDKGNKEGGVGIILIAGALLLPDLKRRLVTAYRNEQLPGH